MTTQETGNALVRMRGVSKTYGATRALDNVDFACHPGTIHAILGENGAGKSTLMKLLAGVIQRDQGRIEYFGEEVNFKSPLDANNCGIVCIFQELSVVLDLTVAENIFLSRPDTKFGFIKKENYARARSLLDRVGAGHIDLRERCGNLSLAERQQVEIAKALFLKPKLLILDEATSALTMSLVAKLFDLLRELKKEGIGILFISHRLYEIEEIADVISVFRNGRHIETFPVRSRTKEQIVSLMVGQSIAEVYPAKPGRQNVSDDGPPLLEVKGMSWPPELRDISLSVRAGEIIGIGGLEGQGQRHFMQALFGLLRGTEGQVLLNGREHRIASPSMAKANKPSIALIPEDRKTEGLIPDMSISDNVSLALLGSMKGGLYSEQNISGMGEIQAILKKLALVYRDLGDEIAHLSGGNQQKIAIAKWLILNPSCLLLMDPTRGIDVKTKSQLYYLFRELADKGMAIVLHSTDYEELVWLCDRVHIFYQGKINAVLENDTLTEKNVVSASMDLLDKIQHGEKTA